MPVSVIQNASFGNSGVVTANGIKFPATKVPSADANTLDDYEEGTWTPQFLNTTATYDTESTTGKYTKIGNICVATGVVTTSALTRNGNQVLVSLPFLVDGSTASYGAISVFIETGFNPSGGAGNIQGISFVSTSYFGVWTIASVTGNNYTSVLYNDLQTVSNRIRFTIAYSVA
jgi:hypothetical protein